MSTSTASLFTSAIPLTGSSFLGNSRTDGDKDVGEVKADVDANVAAIGQLNSDLASEQAARAAALAAAAGVRDAEDARQDAVDLGLRADVDSILVANTAAAAERAATSTSLSDAFASMAAGASLTYATVDQTAAMAEVTAYQPGSCTTIPATATLLDIGNASWDSGAAVGSRATGGVVASGIESTLLGQFGHVDLAMALDAAVRVITVHQADEDGGSVLRPLLAYENLGAIPNPHRYYFDVANLPGRAVNYTGVSVSPISMCIAKVTNYVSSAVDVPVGVDLSGVSRLYLMQPIATTFGALVTPLRVAPKASFSIMNNSGTSISVGGKIVSPAILESGSGEVLDTLSYGPWAMTRSGDLIVA